MTVNYYTSAKYGMAVQQTGCKLDGDIKILLAMTNTTLDTENDAMDFIDDFTTLDEHNGGGYARIALSVSTPVVAKDTARDSVTLKTTAHPVFPSLAAGTRDVDGVLFYFNVLDDDAQSVPFIYAKYTTPRVPDGGNFTIELPANKLIIELFQVAAGTSPILID